MKNQRLHATNEEKKLIFSRDIELKEETKVAITEILSFWTKKKQNQTFNMIKVSNHKQQKED